MVAVMTKSMERSWSELCNITIICIFPVFCLIFYLNNVFLFACFCILFSLMQWKSTYSFTVLIPMNFRFSIEKRGNINFNMNYCSEEGVLCKSATLMLWGETYAVLSISSSHRLSDTVVKKYTKCNIGTYWTNRSSLRL